MEEIIIRGKTFSKEEVIEAGNKRNKRLTNIFRWVGVGLIGLGIIGFISLLGSASESETIELGPAILELVIFAIPGIVLFILSFIKRDAFNSGKKELEKHFPAPIGFDGNVIDVIEGDKTLVLSRNTNSSITIDSKTKQFQVCVNKRFSKIYDAKDLVDYEIRVDNEIIVTSKTKTRKGVGKALIGGALFGGAGAVAGAVAGNKKSKTTETQKEIHHYSFVLKVNDISKPSFIFELDSAEIAEDVVTIFDILVGNTKKFAEPEEVNEVSKKEEIPKLDKFEEIKKYKDLLDNGIITQEEFDAKKKELLD